MFLVLNKGAAIIYGCVLCSHPFCLIISCTSDVPNPLAEYTAFAHSFMKCRSSDQLDVASTQSTELAKQGYFSKKNSKVGWLIAWIIQTPHSDTNIAWFCDTGAPSPNVFTPQTYHRPHHPSSPLTIITITYRPTSHSHLSSAPHNPPAIVSRRSRPSPNSTTWTVTAPEATSTPTLSRYGRGCCHGVSSQLECCVIGYMCTSTKYALRMIITVVIRVCSTTATTTSDAESSSCATTRTLPKILPTKVPGATRACLCCRVVRFTFELWYNR